MRVFTRERGTPLSKLCFRPFLRKALSVTSFLESEFREKVCFLRFFAILAIFARFFAWDSRVLAVLFNEHKSNPCKCVFSARRIWKSGPKKLKFVKFVFKKPRLSASLWDGFSVSQGYPLVLFAKMTVFEKDFACYVVSGIRVL